MTMRMARMSKQVLGIDPKMYRHFAAVTLAISGMVALFANGEAQQAIAKSNDQAELKRAEQKKFGAKKLVDNRSEGGSRGRGSGFRDNIDGPMDGSGDGGGMIPANLTVSAAPVIVEVDKVAMARMSPEQRAAYLRMLEAERRRRLEQGPVLPTQAQIDALASAAAARAGSDSVD